MRPRIRERLAALARRLGSAARRRPHRQARCAGRHLRHGAHPRNRDRDRRQRPADHLRARPQSDLLYLRRRACLSPRRRHIVAGMCETDYSGYPDCRDDTVKAMQVALGLGLDRRVIIHTPLMWIDKAGDLRPGRGDRRRRPCSISLSRTPIAAISATARTATTGAMAAANARPASLRARGFARIHEPAKRPDKSK